MLKLGLKKEEMIRKQPSSELSWEMQENRYDFFLSCVGCPQTLFDSTYGEILFPGIVSKLYLPGK